MLDSLISMKHFTSIRNRHKQTAPETKQIFDNNLIENIIPPVAKSEYNKKWMHREKKKDNYYALSRIIFALFLFMCLFYVIMICLIYYSISSGNTSWLSYVNNTKNAIVYFTYIEQKRYNRCIMLDDDAFSQGKIRTTDHHLIKCIYNKDHPMKKNDTSFLKSMSMYKREESTKYRTAEPLISSYCKEQYKWQLMSFPTCNNIHEVSHQSDNVSLFAKGYWRDVWSVEVENSNHHPTESNTNTFALKTMRFKHDVTPPNFDRHRRDALASERLTFSQNVVSIYAFCGNSATYEYSDSGSISQIIYEKNKYSKAQLLTIAIQISTALADLHNFDQEGVASIAHADITLNQFVLIHGVYKLTDFNRCRFIPWSRTKDRPCGYHVGHNPGSFRSPEEYQYKKQSEKVDVYSMGNIFYALLANRYPWQTTKVEVAQENVIHGKRPHLPIQVENSTQPVDIAIKSAMEMCFIQNPRQRASAREIVSFLTYSWKQFHYHIKIK